MRSYDERLWVPWRWWVIPGFFLWSLWLAYHAALGPAWALPVTALATAVVAGVLVGYGRARIRVDGQTLEAGRARIPLHALGRTWPLDTEQARELRGPGADASAFMLLRGYVPTAVRVDIADPDDPTPYAYLSTRHPERLAAALDQARGRAPAAGPA
jgi:hypothetical protein